VLRENVEKDLDERCALVGEHSRELPDVRGRRFRRAGAQASARGRVTSPRSASWLKMPIRRVGRRVPQQRLVVCELGAAPRRLERNGCGSLAVHARETMADRSVLPRGIQS